MSNSKPSWIIQSFLTQAKIRCEFVHQFYFSSRHRTLTRSRLPLQLSENSQGSKIKLLYWAPKIQNIYLYQQIGSIMYKYSLWRINNDKNFLIF